MGDRPLSPIGVGGDRPLFFGQGPRCKFEEKKLHLGSVAPHTATGGIFEIFQNGHIFLKFLFFKNIKKKKPLYTFGPIFVMGRPCTNFNTEPTISKNSRKAGW